MFKRWRILHRLILAALVAVGLGIVWAAVGFWGISLAESATREAPVYEQLYFLADGTPVVHYYRGTSYNELTYRTLDGREIELDAYERTTLQGGQLNGPRWQQQPFRGMDWWRRMQAFSDNHRPRNYWYFIHNGRRDGRGYFVGYHSEAKRVAGYIGRKGYRPAKPPIDEQFRISGPRYVGGAFAMSGYTAARVPNVYYTATRSVPPGQVPPWVMFVLDDEGLLRIDLSERRVHRVLKSTDLVSAGIVSRPQESAAGDTPVSPQYLQFVAVRTTDRVLLLDADGKQVNEYPLPVELQQTEFQFYETADRTAIVHASHWTRQAEFAHRVFWLDEAGEVTRLEEVVLSYGVRPMSPHWQSSLASLAIPSPLATGAAACLIVPAEYLQFGEEWNYAFALARSLWEWWPGLLISVVTGAIAAWWCYRRQKQFAADAVWPWVVFVFVGGIPGLLGYLVGRDWPHREACPHCHQPAVRDREQCTACGQEFPLPELRGNEVFA